MASYQDIEDRLRTAEEKIDFVMKSFTVRKKEGVIDPKITIYNLLQLYNASKAAGVQLEGSGNPDSPVTIPATGEEL